ncbi:Transmembrane protein [Orchesella cincta]|uniref:Transmembrane protein n=1 Tax=Orchesella cincta TaxID=48709 RepID=A0A1D2MV58_ORCCI|nr:Transmembrane protein [Orchesella cincta]
MGCGDFCARLGRWCFHCFLRWRLWIRPFFILGYTIVLCILVPSLVFTCLGHECSKQQRTQLIGGVFALLAIPISFWEITQHLVHYTKPYLQKHVIRILWMVPVYALDAWIGLLAPEYSIYCNSLRECYEAYVIYNFMKFLLNYLNAEMDLEANLEMKQQASFWSSAILYLLTAKYYHILTGLIFYRFTTFFLFAVFVIGKWDKNSICELFGVYGEDEYRSNMAFPYIIAINNVSQFVAMYCLVLFYRANKDELQPMRPIGKFLCIKSVVFFSFFQGVAISILVNTGIIANVFGTTEKNDIKDISSSLQNFLICIEMFFAALAHHYAFSYKAYVDMAAEQPNCCESFCQMWDVSDVKQDLEEHIGVMKNTVRQVMPSRVYRHPGGLREERAHLLSTSDEPATSSSGPVQAAAVRLVAEMDPKTRSPVDDDSDGGNFTDLTEDAKLCSKD